jgi:hypothetical protein
MNVVMWGKEVTQANMALPWARGVQQAGPA